MVNSDHVTGTSEPLLIVGPVNLGAASGLIVGRPK
jgi:hypothetical protein